MTPRSPVAPDEHPSLPALRGELYPATNDTPAYARWLLSPLRVRVTASPDRLRQDAQILLDLAEGLDAAIAEGPPGQQALDVGTDT